MRRRALLAGAAVALAVPGAARAAREPKGEVAILREALELEKLAVFLYATALERALVEGELKVAVETLRAHEQQHAEAIAQALEALGAARPWAPRSEEDADALLERHGATGRLAAVSSREAFFALAEEVELLQVGAYVEAAGGLDDVRLIQTTASILAADGAHLVVIRQALGREPVPNALERGRA